jgi:protein arginine N-methyltransferase 6
MLKDFTRTDAYRRAIVENPQDFQGKVVLDVGCGTGVLSIFCVRAGAKKVYGIEASSIGDYAIQVVAANHLSDRITILKGLVEDIELPEKVDVIVSEWMGYFLIYEAMLKTVIYARDKWLKEDGLMYPAEAKLYISAFSDPDYYKSKIDFWNDVFGIDMSVLIPFAKQCSLVGAAVDSIKGENVVCDPIVIKTINCRTVTAPELDLTHSEFSFRFNRTCRWHGFAGWFDVTFRPGYLTHSTGEKTNVQQQTIPVGEGSANCGSTVVLSTAPEIGYTHWHQTLFPFEEQASVMEGQELKGTIVVKPKLDAPRHLFITLNYTTTGETYSHCYDF